MKNGDERFVFLDAATALQIMTITRRMVDGNKIEIESTIGHYRTVDGVLLPHSVEATAAGVPQRPPVTFDKSGGNVPPDASRFRLP